MPALIDKAQRKRKKKKETTTRREIVRDISTRRIFTVVKNKYYFVLYTRTHVRVIFLTIRTKKYKHINSLKTDNSIFFRSMFFFFN